MSGNPTDERESDNRPPWARKTLRPECPACGKYVLPCTETASGVHPDTWDVNR